MPWLALGAAGFVVDDLRWCAVCAKCLVCGLCLWSALVRVFLHTGAVGSAAGSVWASARARDFEQCYTTVRARDPRELKWFY